MTNHLSLSCKTPSQTSTLIAQTEGVHLMIQDLVTEITPHAQIGEGSFGGVWKGTRSGSLCAVKMLHGVRWCPAFHISIKSKKEKKKF